MGKSHRKGDEAYRIALADGLSPFRAQVAGHVASFPDAWVPRATIAEMIGCCVKTVQRGLNQLKELGRVRIWPAPPTEVLPGRTKPLRFWASHRVWQWGAAAVERSKVAQVVKAVVQPRSAPKVPALTIRQRAAADGWGDDVVGWLDAGGIPKPDTS